MARFTVTASVGTEPDTRTITVDGRPGWLLQRLVEAGERGLSTVDLQAGLRISHFVWVLRTKHFITVATERETHGGAFAGSHARYRLAVPVRIIEDAEAAA